MGKEILRGRLGVQVELVAKLIAHMREGHDFVWVVAVLVVVLSRCTWGEQVGRGEAAAVDAGRRRLDDTDGESQDVPVEEYMRVRGAQPVLSEVVGQSPRDRRGA